MNKKILLICNESNAVISFRKELIIFLIKRGYSITVIASDNNREKDIKKLGANFFVVKYNNRGTNIFENLSLTSKFKKVIKSINPNIVFTFQVKPNVFGTRAAKQLGVKSIYSMVEGLGDPFQPTTFKGRCIRDILIKLYRRGLKNSQKVFFLNEDDKNYFVKHNICKEDKCIVINGIGINVNNFVASASIPKTKKVIMLSRLIKNKGILEYCELARAIRKDRKDITFELYGSESELDKKDLEDYINDGSIVYGGFTNDAKTKILESNIVVSMSYREGMPVVIMEAMALAKPVIATNVVGNKNAVIDNVTGYLIDIDNKEEFKQKLLLLIDDEQLQLKFGKNARKVCEERFDSETINNQILSIIEGQ